MADLNEFRKEILEEVHFNASENGTSPKEEFLVLYTAALADAEEFEDFEQLSYEGVGPQNRKIVIDGYFFDELENCLAIITCPFDDSLKVQSLTATDAETHFRRARAFVEEARSGFIQKYAEESSPGYGLAIDIQKRYSNVDKYKFYIITDMVMSSRIREIKGSRIGNATAEYHIWDIERLQGLYNSKTGKEEITIDLKKFTGNGIPCLLAGSNAEYTAYLCNIPGIVLAELYNTYGGRLLEGNVRSFLTARGKINKGIRNTILNEPTMFFAYNNGIAATAYEVKIELGKNSPLITEIRSLQIVNGGQTTASLASAINNDKDRANNLKDIYVPMKLSVVTPEKAMELIPFIARYANKQNKVSDADFFSNHAFHVRMEEHSRRIIAPAVMGNQYGTYWYYERARGQYAQEQAKLTKNEKERFLRRNPKNQMFTKTDLAKVYNLYRQFPHQVSRGAQKNFISFAEWASATWDKDPSVFNDLFFKQIVCLNILFKELDHIVFCAPWYEKGYKAQIVSYALAYFFYQIGRECPDKVFDFKYVWNQQSISHETEIAFGIIAEKMFYHLTSPKREVDNVTEWAKRESCWEKAKEISIPFSEQFKAELNYKVLEKEANIQARKEQKNQDSASAMIKVAKYGAQNWKKVLDWGIANRIFGAKDISLLKTAVSMNTKFPSEKQCVQILKILEKAREESFPG